MCRERRAKNGKTDAVSAKTYENGAGEKNTSFDHDGHWKDLIECFFYPLLKRVAPKLYEIADVTAKPRFLDKEFRDILNTSDPEIHTSPHFADFVIEVPTKYGDAQWILCHVEAQGRGGSNLSERMFHYMCLIYGHYRKLPVGMAIVTDGHRNEERFFSRNKFELRTIYEYYNLVLADLDDDELKLSGNPIDHALYSAKCALRAKEELQKYKYLRTLTDILTERGWDANEKRSLMLFMMRIINLKDSILTERYIEYRMVLDKEGKLMYESFLKEVQERMAEKRGIAQGKEEVARRLLARGDYSPEVISEIAGLPMEHVRSLIK